MQIVSNLSQSRWKDSVASSPSIDLCLIANGEERSQVFSSKGVASFAGFDPPEVAPTVALDGAGNLTDDLFVVYKYVYAATSKYPLAKSTQAAGGNLSPRSNPSPASTPFQITGGNKKTAVTVTKTTRPDVDKIWVYRTQLFVSAELAQVAGEAGLLFYLGEVTNDGNTGVAEYSDNSLSVQEQIENDNLVAPTCQFAAYYDPYFFLFGANEIEVEVDLAITGIITILNTFDGTWFSGRNGQFVKLQGVETGGFDGFGTFYFKFLTSTTAQLTLDASGDTLASAPFFGTTKAKVYGFSTSLYRSKPNNPFAWGETVTIGTAVVSRSWVMKVGGGKGIAMTVIPSSSLLKLDLDGPPRSFVFNLKQTQTDAFKATRRLISDTYIPSNNFCQFTGLDENKQLQTFALDSRNFTITQTDGGSVVPIGDNAFLELRKLISETSKHIHFHGFYDPNTELNCFFYREDDGLPHIHRMIYNHAPSHQWGTLDCFDVQCSAVVVDSVTGKTIVLGGTSGGFVGQLLYPNKAINWLDDQTMNDANTYGFGVIESIESAEQIVTVNPPTITDDLEGRFFVIVGTYLGVAHYYVFYYGTDIPTYLVPYPNGSNYDIFYLQIDYTPGDTVIQLAGEIYNTIIAARADSGGYPNFGLDATNVDPSKVEISWDRLVLSDIPLNQYYDFNSGTTFELTNRGGVLITYTNEIWDIGNNPIDADVLARFRGNWAIWNIHQYGTEGDYFWGRISHVESLSVVDEPDRILVYLDYMYSPYLRETLYVFAGLAGSNPTIWIGCTECKLKKFFDMGQSSENKNINEVWMAARNSNQFLFSEDVDTYDPLMVATLDQVYEAEVLSIHPVQMQQDKTVSGASTTDNWFARTEIQISPFKTFGLSWSQRGPTNFKISNITLKV